MTRSSWIGSVLALSLCALAFAPGVRAGETPAKKDAASAPSNLAVEHMADANAMRIEGEARFRANCGRCHAAPQKFPPRMMATVLRHMRVRATITDQDMRLVLFYMTQ